MNIIFLAMVSPSEYTRVLQYTYLLVPIMNMFQAANYLNDLDEKEKFRIQKKTVKNLVLSKKNFILVSILSPLQDDIQLTEKKNLFFFFFSRD